MFRVRGAIKLDARSQRSWRGNENRASRVDHGARADLAQGSGPIILLAGPFHSGVTITPSKREGRWRAEDEETENYTYAIAL